MKFYFSSILLFFIVFSSCAQSDSIFTNLKNYEVDICTHAWDWEGLYQLEYLTVYSDNPMSDTLRVIDQISGTEIATLLLDGRKTWIRIDSVATQTVMEEYYYPFNSTQNPPPVNEYIVLYDFEILDTSSVGDTVIFGDTSNNVSLYIQGIDTIYINGVQKTRYNIITGEYGLREDFLIEGVGGLHPFTPLLYQGFFGTCSCKFEATYSNQTDTLVLRDTMIFGSDYQHFFCLTAGLPEFEKSDRIQIYPNPVSGNYFTIQSENGINSYQINLYNTQGKKILIKNPSFTTENYLNIPVNNLPEGFYMVEIIDDFNHYVKKIIIQ